MRHLMLSIALVAACQEYTIDKPAQDVDLGTIDSDVALGICGAEFQAPTVQPLPGCTPYEVRGFHPSVEWHGGMGRNSNALPAVADLDGDGLPEIIANTTAGGVFGAGKGQLWAMHGDGSGRLWTVTDADLGFASAPSVGDIDGDGHPEVLGIRAKGGQIFAGLNAPFTVVAWSHEGHELWESEVYTAADFDYAGGLFLSDMDHDGQTEIVAGRVILNHDGTERGAGVHGSGGWTRGEASYPAVADTDLDGVEEVIVGNARYSPDGDTLWHDANAADGMVAVANLDEDPEAEWVVSSGDTVRAHDTDGSLLWGPIRLRNATVTSPAAISDLDNDGMPEIAIAGGNQFLALNHDGTILWERAVSDLSGGTGASIFDFDADGIEEVVYIDELNVYAFNGSDGAIKFETDEHTSNTMMDYPIIADVDGDGAAEILVSHVSYWPRGSIKTAAFSIYGEGDGTWAPARPLWNQHAYARNHIQDDLTIPSDALPPFTDHNSWRSATDPDLTAGEDKFDLQVQVMDVCEIACDRNIVELSIAALNASREEVPEGVPVTVYARVGNEEIALGTVLTQEPMASGAGELVELTVDATIVSDATALRVAVDDSGNGGGTTLECVENDNSVVLPGPFCTGR